MPLAVYEKAMPDALSWREKLEEAQRAGFDGVEMSVDESEGRLGRLYWSDDQRTELWRLSHEIGVPIGSLCLSAHRRYPLGGRDTAAQGLDILRRAVELAAVLGIRMIQLAGYDVYYEMSTPETSARFEENLWLAAEYAADGGVYLGFETMETPFMNTVEKSMVYVRKIHSPYLQVYPDLGNLTNGAPDVEADLRTGTGHLLAAHLKETRPGVFRDLHFGEGRVDFAAGIRVLKELGVRRYTAEFWYDGNTDWRSELKKAHDYLQGILSGEEKENAVFAGS